MAATKSDLFEGIAVAMEGWTRSVSRAVMDRTTKPRWVEDCEPYLKVQQALANSSVEAGDVEKILSESFRGFAISILTMIDGGTALAEKGRIYLVDDKGRKLGEGLHDDFVSHLLDSGRIE